MSIAQRMLDAAKDVWAQYNEHPFVKGIANGTLDREKFRFYIIQDYLYLADYARVFAIGVAKAKSMETSGLFTGYLEALNGEMDIHKGYIGRLGVTQEEIDATPRSLDNISYTSYMLRVAYEDGEAEILAAVMACAWSYEVIAKKMIADYPAAAEHEFYGEWVSGYASDEYAAENVELVDMLEKLTAHCTEAQVGHLIDIFVTCSRYELAFWEMAWNMSM